ncbi:hypothetical protein [Endozoicomonas elysicola]|nr:hypothetical protein [Endozoicomonas elysicola]
MDIALSTGFIAKISYTHSLAPNKLVFSSRSNRSRISITQCSGKKPTLPNSSEEFKKNSPEKRIADRVSNKRLRSEILNTEKNHSTSSTSSLVKEESVEISCFDQRFQNTDIKPEPSFPLDIDSYHTLQHDHDYAKKVQPESNSESVYPLFLFKHSGVSHHLTGGESQSLQQAESNNSNIGSPYEMDEELPLFQCNWLKRKRAGDAGENGYRCVILDCKQKDGIQRPSFTSHRNWHDHMISKHGNGYPDPRNEDNPLTNSHAFGESILAIQNNIVCKVNGCYEFPFGSFKELGMHLKTQHKDVLDCQPFNLTWKPGVRKTETDRFLSQLNNDHYLGKRYQTRHGNGFLCFDPPCYPVRQTPEGLCDYWLDSHVGFRSLCPIRSCTFERGELLGFRDYKGLYQHMKSQHPEPLNNESLDFSPFTSAILSSFQALPLLVSTNT